MSFLISSISVILIIHWVADFIFQTHYMATNKSKSVAVLGEHIFVYTSILTCISVMIFAPYISPALIAQWALCNGCFHFVTDYFTSKLTSKLYAENKVHEFFAIVGLDQLIHTLTLILTFTLLL